MSSLSIPSLVRRPRAMCQLPVSLVELTIIVMTDHQLIRSQRTPRWFRPMTTLGVS